MKTIGLLVLISGCDDGKVTIDASNIGDSYTDTGAVNQDDTGHSDVDRDGDGYPLSDDCDDSDASIYPGAEEICNGLDDDCDGSVDNVPPSGDFESLWFQDGDGDGYGAGEAEYFPCEAPPTHVNVDGDCADDDVDVHPGMEEICDDGKDNNCDGSSIPCVLEGIIPSDHAAHSIVGWQPLERIGSIAESAGDVNGDGLDDLLVAVPRSSEYLHEAGAIYMFTSPLDGTQTIEEADGIFLGSDVEEHAGETIAAVGDIDGDGREEIAVGIPNESSMGHHSGSVSIVKGPGTGALNLQDAAYRFVGEGADFHTGADVISVGDTDGDGVSEIAIGASGATTDGGDVGAIYLVQPRGEGTFNLMAEASSKLTGVRAGGLLRMDIQPAGDFDGDGYQDVLVGTPHMEHPGMPEESGGAYVLYGPLPESGSIETSSSIFYGESTHGYGGFSVATLGPTMEDERSQIAVGCYNCDGTAATSGAVFLFQGSDVGTHSLADADVTIAGEAYQDFAGYSIANGGDINGDGVADLLIGAKGNDFGTATTGAAYLLYGPTTTDMALTTAHLKIHGIHNNDQFGTKVGSAGDIDGDGLGDFLVGSPMSDSSYEDVGRVSVFMGNERL